MPMSCISANNHSGGVRAEFGQRLIWDLEPMTIAFARLACLLWGCGEAGLEVGEGFLQAFAEGDCWLPAEQGAGFGDVGTTAGGVVLGQRLMDDGGL